MVEDVGFDAVGVQYIETDYNMPQKRDGPDREIGQWLLCKYKALRQRTFMWFMPHELQFVGRL